MTDARNPGEVTFPIGGPRPSSSRPLTVTLTDSHPTYPVGSEIDLRIPADSREAQWLELSPAEVVSPPF